MTQQFFIEFDSLWARENGGRPARVCGLEDRIGVFFDGDEGVLMDINEISAVQDKFDRMSAYWRKLDLIEMMDSLEVISLPIDEITVDRLNGYVSGSLDVSGLKADFSEQLLERTPSPSPSMN